MANFLENVAFFEDVEKMRRAGSAQPTPLTPTERANGEPAARAACTSAATVWACTVLRLRSLTTRSLRLLRTLTLRSLSDSPSAVPQMIADGSMDLLREVVLATSDSGLQDETFHSMQLYIHHGLPQTL